MIKLWPFPALVLLLAGLLVQGTSLPPALESPLDTGSDALVNQSKRVFVRYKPDYHDALLHDLKIKTKLFDPSSSTTVLYDFPSLHAYVLTLGSPEEVQTIVQHPLVEEVHDDPPRTCSMVADSTEFKYPSNLRNNWESQQIPYGVEMVQAPAVWHLGVKGAGVRVCLVDTGLDFHHVDLDQTLLQGYQESWYKDEWGHGTHVAGTIVAIDNQIGLVGVAPEAEIYTVKIDMQDDGSAFSSSLIHATFACRDAGSKIIHMSFGGIKWNPFEQEVFRSLLESDGILSFAAAGNNGGRRPHYPASYSMVTSVAAVDVERNHDVSSQQNGRVDLAAPGVGVLSLLPNGDCKMCRQAGATQGYGVISGTEMATAHAAGVAALLWSYKPEANAQEIVLAMEQSATDLGDPGWDPLYGHGLVNALHALEWLSDRPVLTLNDLLSVGQDPLFNLRPKSATAIQ